MKKIRIIHINLSPGFAGSERHLVDLVNFQSDNYDTYLIKLKKNSFINYSIISRKTKIYKISKFFKSIIYFLYMVIINRTIITTFFNIIINI